MKPVLIRCRCCAGTGKEEFTGEFADTLRYIRETCPRDEFTAADLARQVGINPTAMSNRLRYLESLGFLAGTPYGRRRLFKLKQS